MLGKRDAVESGARLKSRELVFSGKLGDTGLSPPGIHEAPLCCRLKAHLKGLQVLLVSAASVYYLDFVLWLNPRLASREAPARLNESAAFRATNKPLISSKLITTRRRTVPLRRSANWSDVAYHYSSPVIVAPRKVSCDFSADGARVFIELFRAVNYSARALSL